MIMTPRIDGDRLWRSLMALAEVGATAGGGVCRLALSDDDLRGRELFVRWCNDAGLRLSVDTIGNLFARRRGRDEARPPVLTGSHLDTQPNGGRFDGAYGVLAGLEVMRTLNDAGAKTDAPLEVVVWTNEEGTRFAPSMMGSMAFAGLLPLDTALAARDDAGSSVGDELARLGYRGEGLGHRAIDAYFEAHIEQGPLLEQQGCTIGVVTQGQGQCWYDVVLRGQSAHAGTTPMSQRRDALAAAAELVLAVQQIGLRFDGCATVGRLDVRPNSRNVIPGEVAFSIEIRHPVDSTRRDMDRAVRECVEALSRRLALDVQLVQLLDQPATPFDARCVDLVRDAAVGERLSHMDMISGAAHDAIAIARIAPAAMVFVPCAGGISHNEAESAAPSDLAAGCQVLLDAMLARAKMTR
jgi:N-carbamoyl-L-amino-acid hydrolase